MESGEASLPATTRTDVLKFHVESRIKHRYARTVITSIVANNADHAQEVIFNITLPESAFISAFQMEIDGKVYKAHVNEKEEAKQEYAHAVSLGLSAAHVEQSVRDSSKFNVSVNVEKTQTVTFKLTYEELLKRELSAYKHVINIDPGQIVPELLVEVYIDESDKLSLLEVPPLQEKSEMQLNPSDEVNTLAKIERPKPNEGIVRWSPSIGDQKKLGANGVKGQLVVRYDVNRKSKPEQILVNNGYFVHFFAPTDLPVLRKHVVFVLDVSGSMQGRKIEQLKDAMKTILNDIGSDDFFSLIMFSTDVRVWDPDVVEPVLRAETARMFVPCSDSPPVEKLPETVVVPATMSNIEKAKLFVSSLHDDSATNIHGALLRAIEVVQLGKDLHKSKKISGVRPEPMIIFLTDGQPNVGESHPDNITSITTTANKDTRAVLFSLAFGDDADMGFLKKLSLQNSGFARKIYEAADAALQLNHFYRLVSSPLLANVKFKYEDKEVVPGSVTNTNFRTLFGGSELVIAGRLCSDTISGEMVSDSCGVEKCSCICKPTVIAKKEYEFMERLWAFLTIKQLLDNVTADADVAENKKQALELALKYSFVTPLTSLVVVKPDKLVEETNVERDDVKKYRDSKMFLRRKMKRCSSPEDEICESASESESPRMGYSAYMCAPQSLNTSNFVPMSAAFAGGFGGGSLAYSAPKMRSVPMKSMFCAGVPGSYRSQPPRGPAVFGSGPPAAPALFGSGPPAAPALFGSGPPRGSAVFGSGLPGAPASFAFGSGPPGHPTSFAFGSGPPGAPASFGLGPPGAPTSFAFGSGPPEAPSSFGSGSLSGPALFGSEPPRGPTFSSGQLFGSGSSSSSGQLFGSQSASGSGPASGSGAFGSASIQRSASNFSPPSMNVLSNKYMAGKWSSLSKRENWGDLSKHPSCMLLSTHLFSKTLAHYFVFVWFSTFVKADKAVIESWSCTLVTEMMVGAIISPFLVL